MGTEMFLFLELFQRSDGVRWNAEISSAYGNCGIYGTILSSHSLPFHFRVIFSIRFLNIIHHVRFHFYRITIGKMETPEFPFPMHWNISLPPIFPATGLVQYKVNQR